MNNRINKRWWTPALDALTSLKLAIVLLVTLMALVVACTLAQVDLGTHGAVEIYMRSLVVWWRPAGASWSLPVLPGGAVVGGLLMVNLALGQLRRLQWTWKKSGMWLLHFGLILLVAGEFVSALLQVDSRLTIEEGQSINFTERTREFEVAVIDTTNAAFDAHHGIPQGLLKPGATVAVPTTPLTAKVIDYQRNSELRNRTPLDPKSAATAGVGTEIHVQPLPPVAKDDARDSPSCVVEIVADGASKGVFLVSAEISAQQGFVHAGRSYHLELRQRREYLPYSLTLNKFSHDVYPGTDIPKNFSSLVRLIHPERSEDRTVLIYMNQPLRYAGRTFYQASFGKNDTLSVLQVVQNPGWLLPYVACALVTLGLLIHFSLSMGRLKRPKIGAVPLEAT